MILIIYIGCCIFLNPFFLQNVLVICFSITSQRSFSSIEEDWIPEIKQHCPGVPYVLVGCQKDWREEYENRGQDVVTTAEV